MTLFEYDIHKNLLPSDGVAKYFGKIFSEKDSIIFFEKLFNNIEWANDEIMMYGKKIITKRKVGWYADGGISYKYSNTIKNALPFTNELLEIKKVVETSSGNTFNACLLNLYHNGNEGMGWHSDNEKEIEENSCIASISFGAERKFMLKHRITKETVTIILENGSLLSMEGSTQKNWLHQLPKSTKISSPRINLTFRKMIVY